MNTTSPRLHQLSALLLSLTGALAQAQAQTPMPPMPPLPEPAETSRMLIAQLDGNLAFARAELSQERIVKGAPYCADAVHETVQPLADGNRIVRTQSSRLCRDGEGRTRQEVDRGGRHIVYLRDPVARESWMLDSDHKTARRLGSLGLSDPGVDQAAWRDYSQRMHEWAAKVSENVRINIAGGRKDLAPAPPTPPVPPVPPAPPAPVVITQGEGGVHVLRVDVGSPMAVALPRPGMQPMELTPPSAVVERAMTFAPRGSGVQSPLGSKEIDGVKVSGERKTWTIEAGKVGNEKPILITRDVWSSPELMLTIQSRDFDPRSGEINYRLQNLKRGEPDAALMRVPGDFAVSKPPEPRSRSPKASEPTAKG